MPQHPYHDVAITGIFNTEQARVLEGEDSMSIAFKGGLGALADAGLGIRDVDGVVGQFANDFVYQARLSPVWVTSSWSGIPAILQAATAIAAGMATKVLVLAGTAGVYVDRASTAPWTRPSSEFVAPFGMFTAAEFALVARRHMHRYGTKPDALAAVAAVIRNNGHVHPGAIYRGARTVHARRTSSTAAWSPTRSTSSTARPRRRAAAGWCSRAPTSPTDAPRQAGVRARRQRRQRRHRVQEPADVGAGRQPSRRLGERHGRTTGGGGLLPHRRVSGPTDVDVCEFYDPFSFEIIRQFEAFGFCGEGEGGDFVTSGAIEPGGQYPVTTDGGVMSYSHAGASAQMLQRVIRGVEQLRGECESNQVDGAEVAMCSNGGSGALFTDVMLLGVEQSMRKSA